MSAAQSWVDEADLRVAAYHESGHAVVAASLDDVTIKEVVLREPGHPTEGGHCVIDEAFDVIDESLIGYLTCLAAGAEAERRLTGRPSKRDGGDRQQAEDVTSLVLGTEPTSARVVQMLDNAALLARVKMQEDVIWKWIERVADVLIKRRRLSGFDIHQLKPRGRR